HDRAVIDDGDERAGDRLTNTAGVVAGAFAGEVCFQAVPDGLVEEDAAVACSEDDGEHSGGSFDGALLEDRLPGGIARELFRRNAFEVFEAHASAAAGAGYLAAFALVRERADVEADERLHIADDFAIAAGNHDVLQF